MSVGVGSAPNPTDVLVLDATTAAAMFQDFRDVCDADGGELWGQSIYGPMLLVDPLSGILVANRQGKSGSLEERDGVFVGPLPDDLALANTTVEWDGVRWSEVLWPVLWPLPAEARMALLVHEAWHSVQSKLGIPAASGLASHLDEMEARISLRMELSALTAALEAELPEVARSLLARALIYRAERRGSDVERATSEDQLETSEGAAEYTGRKLAHPSPEAAVAIALRDAADTPSFVRSFAYFTGPAYGLLLDALAPGWRPRLIEGATLSELAAEAVTGVTPAETDSDLQNQIASSEQQRAEDRAQRDRQWRQHLVTGPTLRLPISELQTVFDPREVSSLGEHGTVYPSGQLTDRWGRVEVARGGALIDPNWQWISLSAEAMEISGDGVTARGWALELVPGWTIQEREGGHEVVRGGSLTPESVPAS